MERQIQTDYSVGAHAFPLLEDATTFRVPRQTPTHPSDWRGFQVISTRTAATSESIIVVVERKQQHSVSVTGPSDTASPFVSVETTEDSGNSLMALEMAAEMDDERAFLQAARDIDWSQRPAADFVRAVRLALAIGAHLLARNLADSGHRLYPQHEELLKTAHILAPPLVVRADLPADPTAHLNLEWLRNHATEYGGQWVALQDGRLLAIAPTVRQLRAQLSSTKSIFLGRVP